jgi:hypothetical protein
MTVPLKLSTKPAIGIDTIRNFMTHEKDVVYGHLQSCVLRSAFQPVFSLSLNSVKNPGNSKYLQKILNG